MNEARTLVERYMDTWNEIDAGARRAGIVDVVRDVESDQR